MDKLQSIRDNISQSVAGLRGELLSFIENGEWQKPTFPTRALYYSFAQFWFASKIFPKLLCQLAGRIEEDDLRMPLVKNIWDEHGGGDYKKTHRFLYQNFLREFREKTQLDVDSPLFNTPQAAISSYLSGWIDVMQNQPVACALGALGPGAEEVVPDEFRAMTRLIRSKVPISEEGLTYFVSHETIDESHSSDVWDMLLLLSGGRAEAIPVEHVLSGAKQGVELEIRYWQAVVAEAAQLVAK